MVADTAYAYDVTEALCDVRERPLMICLLGSFGILHAGRPVMLGLGEKKRALLSFLALRHGFRVEREVLLDALWPESDMELAGQALHSLVHSLYKLLGPILGGIAPLVFTDGGYRLHMEGGVEVDIDRFATLADAGDR